MSDKIDQRIKELIKAARNLQAEMFLKYGGKTTPLLCKGTFILLVINEENNLKGIAETSQTEDAFLIEKYLEQKKVDEKL